MSELIDNIGKEVIESSFISIKGTKNNILKEPLLIVPLFSTL